MITAVLISSTAISKLKVLAGTRPSCAKNVMAYNKPQVNGGKMSSKNYAKFDRTFMPFGSIMNSLQHITSEENFELIADRAWEWSKEHVSLLVDELSEEGEEQVL